MYVSLAFILTVCSIHGVVEGLVKVRCDNEKAMFLLYKKV